MLNLSRPTPSSFDRADELSDQQRAILEALHGLGGCQNAHNIRVVLARCGVVEAFAAAMAPIHRDLDRLSELGLTMDDDRWTKAKATGLSDHVLRVVTLTDRGRARIEQYLSIRDMTEKLAARIELEPSLSDQSRFWENPDIWAIVKKLADRIKLWPNPSPRR